MRLEVHEEKVILNTLPCARQSWLFRPPKTVNNNEQMQRATLLRYKIIVRDIKIPEAKILISIAVTWLNQKKSKLLILRGGGTGGISCVFFLANNFQENQIEKSFGFFFCFQPVRVTALKKLVVQRSSSSIHSKWMKYAIETQIPGQVIVSYTVVLDYKIRFASEKASCAQRSIQT